MSEESCWVCPNCEAKVPSDLDTCPECGYSEAVEESDLEEPIPEEVLRTQRLVQSSKHSNQTKLLEVEP